MLSTRYWTFFAIVIAAIGYSMFKPAPPVPVIQSPSDDYSYRYTELENGLKVLLVSTPDTDKAAAAVSVNVGSGDNPQHRPGLAHFLEHMLFLGTDAYPEPGEYQAYISRHGGRNNAFTAYRQTTYYFSIDNDAYEGALDRFAPFFISPRFDSAYVEREKNAVNAEYLAKIK
ncbi:MAG: insulinase family protein, partial [Oceanobacter sp.]